MRAGPCHQVAAPERDMPRNRGKSVVEPVPWNQSCRPSEIPSIKNDISRRAFHIRRSKAQVLSAPPSRDECSDAISGCKAHDEQAQEHEQCFKHHQSNRVPCKITMRLTASFQSQKGPLWFRHRNTGFLRNPQGLWKTVSLAPAGAGFHSEQISSGRGIAEMRSLLIPARREYFCGKPPGVG